MAIGLLSGSIDITVLVYDMTLGDHEIKDLYDLMDENSSF